jgi:hypothetical protein
MHAWSQKCSKDEEYQAAQEDHELEEALLLSRMTYEKDVAVRREDEDAELEEAIRLSKMQAEPQHPYGEDMPRNAASEQEMLERALAESLKNSSAPAPAMSNAPQEPARLPPRKNLMPSAPPSEEILKQVQALPIVTDEDIAAVQVALDVAHSMRWFAAPLFFFIAYSNTLTHVARSSHWIALFVPLALDLSHAGSRQCFFIPLVRLNSTSLNERLILALRHTMHEMHHMITTHILLTNTIRASHHSVLHKVP